LFRKVFKAISTEDLKMTVQIAPLHDRFWLGDSKRRDRERRHHHSRHGKENLRKVSDCCGGRKIEKGQRVPLDVKAGDGSYSGKYTGNDITLDDQSI